MTSLTAFESKKEKLLPFKKFLRRIFNNIIVAIGLLCIALIIGTFGYHYIAEFSWIDALLNSSMIVTGMGPVGELRSVAAKLFASCYAIFSSLIFITTIGIILAPLAHRILHKFHLDEE